jgi:hypothetical protein
METKQISGTKIEITKVIVTPDKIEKNVYERKFIEEQIIAITEQRDELIAIKEKELKECTDILAEMDKLGIVTVTPKEKPIEEIKPVEEIIK